MDHGSWDRVFLGRFSRHEEELKRLFLELYHGDEAAYDSFVGMLWHMYEARPEGMRAIDGRRLADPDWYRSRDLLGMLMYVGAFAGNLEGVRKKLDYVEECGVNYLHLMPLLESPAGRSDGGYAVADFRRVQPELGTMEELSALAEDCHARSARRATSSTTTGASRRNLKRPCRRSSPPPPRATSPGAGRRARWS